jgi:hypothetical protein
MYNVRLPSLPSKQISCGGNRAGIVSSNGEVMIWRIGGALDQMRISDPVPKYKGYRESALLFHPDSEDTVFVLHLTCPKIQEDDEIRGNIQWWVQKYVHGELQATYSLEYPLQGLSYNDGDDPAQVFCLNPMKIDDNGLYNIASVPLQFPYEFLDLGCHHRWDKRSRRRGNRHLAHRITFDVYKERISTCYFHLPGSHEDNDHLDVVPEIGRHRGNREKTHLWNGHLFLPVLKLSEREPLTLDAPHKIQLKRALLMAIKSCDQISGPPTDVPYIGDYGENSTVWSTAGKFATRDLGLAYCWIGDSHLALQSPSKALLSAEFVQSVVREIRGDGTFVVLFGDYDYVVWCYDRKTQVKGQD